MNHNSPSTTKRNPLSRRFASVCAVGFRRLAVLAVAAAAVLAIFVTACRESHEDNRSLVYAEELMAVAPDSAIVILEQLDPASLKTPEGRARRALLLTWARHKCYIEETDDSLISTAVDYYSSHPVMSPGGRSYLLMALYFQGVIRENDDNLIMALHSYLQAEMEAVPCEDHYMLGYIYRHFCLLYENINAGKESVYFGRKSYEEFSKTDSEGNIAYAACELGYAFNVYCEPDSALVWAGRCLALPFASGDTVLQSEALRLLGIVNGKTGRYDDAVGNYRELLALGEDRFGRRDAVNFALAYHELGQDTEAYAVCRRFLGADSSTVDVPDEILYAAGDLEGAYRSIQRKLTDNSRSAAANARQNLTRALAEFREQELLNEVEHRKKNQLVWILGSCLAAAVIISVIRVLSTRIKRSREALSRAMLKLEILNKDLHTRLTYQKELLREKERVCKEKEEVCENLDRLTKEHEQLKLNFELRQSKQTRTVSNYSNLLENQIKQIEEMAQLYASGDSGSQENKRLVKRVNRLIENYTNPKFLATMEREANFLHDDVVKKFRRSFKGLKDEEVRVFLYQIFGFSSRTVSFLTNEDISMTYNRRSRLKAKISKSESPDKALFLSFFS